MRRYELMLLLRPDLEDDKLQAAVERVTRAIVNGGGSLSKVSPWGKRRLAYDIGRHREASYFLIHFDIEPAHVREIERGMLISEEILRHLVTVIEDRGPVDEIAPAAAARTSDEETDVSPHPAPDAVAEQRPEVEEEAASEAPASSPVSDEPPQATDEPEAAEPVASAAGGAEAADTATDEERTAG